MRHNSPQGSQGLRRECGDGAATKENLGRVWEVVSALATALTNARDQLVTLMHKSTTPRMIGGCRRHATPARPHSPRQTWLPNLHRAHAHSHVAFGSSTEYRLHPTPVRVRQPGPVFGPKPSPLEPVNPPPRRCTHPLHKLQARRTVSPWPPHVGMGSSTHVARASGKRVKSAGTADQERCCIGSQYAALLREDAYQIRERHLAEDGSRRPPWGRC